MRIAELNIGLSSKSLGEISESRALNTLSCYGFRVISKRTQESVSLDGKETCLAVKVELPDHWQDKLASVAKILGQDCVALVGFIGQSPYDTFVKKHWITSDEVQHITELEEKTFYLISNSGDDTAEIKIELSENEASLISRLSAELDSCSNSRYAPSLCIEKFNA